MIYFCPLEETEWAKEHKGQTKMARNLLLAGLHLEYGLRELPQIDADDMGKPYFPATPQIHFNYSHCRKGILCGIGKEKLGVDAEPLRVFHERTARRICHPKELEMLDGTQEDNVLLTKFWVAKEAYLKYLGTGIRSDLRLLDMSGICRRDLHNPDGSVIRLWERDGLYLCACTCAAEELELHFIQI